jgi:hypothetical protein
MHDEKPVPTIVQQINETDVSNDAATRVQRLLREMRKPQMVDMERQFERGDIQAQFPILRLFFEHRNKLDLLQHLLVIVSWTNTVREACSNQYSREEAQQTTIMKAIDNRPGFYDACNRNFNSTFLAAQESSSENHSAVKRNQRVKNCFHRFQRAWKAVRESDFITQRDAERDANIRLIFDECAHIPVEEITDGSLLQLRYVDLSLREGNHYGAYRKTYRQTESRQTDSFNVSYLRQPARVFCLFNLSRLRCSQLQQGQTRAH